MIPFSRGAEHLPHRVFTMPTRCRGMGWPTLLAMLASCVVLGGVGSATEALAQEPERETVEDDRPAPRNGFVADPVVGRGSLLFEFEGTSVSVNRLYQGADEEGAGQLGHFLFVPNLGAEQAPHLAPAEERIRALTGVGDAPRISLGTTRGRFTANEQVLPMRATYGVVERVTIGVTVPVVRRRVDTQLRLSPEGANVGMNPALDPEGGVGAFLAGSQGALAALQEAVDEWCAQAGEGDPRCQEGRSLAEELGGFLGDLALAYGEDEVFFPRAGSDLGAILAGRWEALREGAGEWDAEAPETLPLAVQALDDAAFRREVVAPAWGETGFPLDTPRAFLLLGDVEAHVAVSLLRGRADGRGPVRVRSSVVGTVRFPTGQPDSLRIVAPLDPPRGVGGVELRSVTDVLLPGRFAALAVVEVGRPGSRDMTLLAPDPARPFVPGATRTDARWTPGEHLRIAVTPRYHVHPTMSFGAGWQYLVRRPDRFESLDPGGPPIWNPDRGPRLHRLDLELRYSVLHPPASETLRFPLEFVLRASRTVSGSGPMAPVERRIHFGGRVTLRR